MGTLLAILGILFLTLIVLVPFLEKHAAKSGESKDYSHLTRYIFPLIAVLIVLQLLSYYFFQ